MSLTAIGSTPANGSSSSRNFGSVTSAREIPGHVADDAPAFVGLREMPGFQAAAAAHDRMLAAHRFAARDRVFGQREKMRGCGRTVGWHAGPDVGRKGDGFVAPERPHR